MGKFVVKKVNNEFMFELNSANGQVLCTSRMFTSEASCMKGIESVKRNRRSDVEDQTVDDFVRISNPKYEMFREGEMFRFRLTAMNGDMIIESKPYVSRATCLSRIESVEHNAAELNIVKTY